MFSSMVYSKNCNMKQINIAIFILIATTVVIWGCNQEETALLGQSSKQNFQTLSASLTLPEQLAADSDFIASATLINSLVYQVETVDTTVLDSILESETSTKTDVALALGFSSLTAFEAWESSFVAHVSAYYSEYSLDQMSEPEAVGHQKDALDELGSGTGGGYNPPYQPTGCTQPEYENCMKAADIMLAARFQSGIYSYKKIFRRWAKERKGCKKAYC